MSGTRNSIPILFYRRQVVAVVRNRYRALSKNKDEKNFKLQFRMEVSPLDVKWISASLFLDKALWWLGTRTATSRLENKILCCLWL